MGFRVVCDTKYVEPKPPSVAKARPPKPPPPPTPPPTKPAETPKAAKTPPVNYDEAYVAVAANRERIPHPLSKRTYPTRQRRRNIPVPEGMVYVPAGKFQMGEGQSLHEVYLDAYFIGKYEVTNAEWKAFVDATGHPAPQHWKGGAIPTGRESHPVVYVTWEDAMAYCEWVSRGTGRAVRLPTEAQWEKAARGPEGFLYPWGNTWDASLCNNKARATVAEDPDRGKRVQTTQGPEINTLPVGSFPNGRSEYGCFDMAGNVYEWCWDWHKRDYHTLKDAHKNPQGPSEQESDPIAGESGRGYKAKIARGGSWTSSSSVCRTSRRYAMWFKYGTYHLGFRIAAAAP